MAFQSYTELAAAIAQNLNGLGDMQPTDISGFVALAEAEINRTLRVREMVRRKVSMVDGAYVTLPGDYLAARNITLLSGPQQTLEVVGLDLADRYRVADSESRYYAV